MKFFRFLGRFFLWALIVGLASGIFGVTSSLARIADFYLKEGAGTQKSAALRVVPAEGAPLLKNAVSELKNIEGVTDVYPYFLPQGTVIGAVEYFGFKGSMPIKIKGTPTGLGSKSAAGAYKEEWESLASEKIPVLIPKRAIDLYNASAPERGWPVLPQETFLGLPGVSLTIGERRFEALIAGFDNEEIGFAASAPAEKLYTIYEELGLNPEYTYIDLLVLDGLNKSALAQLRQAISLMGYKLETDNLESLQVRILQRVKFGLLFSGFLIFLGALSLKVLFSLSYYRAFTPRLHLLKIWGLKTPFIPAHILTALLFSCGTALLAWGFCFFFVIPAQTPLMESLGSLGLKLPPLDLSAETALSIGFYSGLCYFLSEVFNLFYFLFTARRNQALPF